MIDGQGLDGAVVAAKDGADWGWTTLYRALAPTITGYLKAQGARDPEDVTAEVFIQAVKGIDRFSGDGAQFKSWIFCIAHNKLVDDVRRRRRRPEDLSPDAGRNLVHPSNVEDQVMRNLSDGRIREMFSRLTVDQRNVLYLRMIGGLTLEEVARVLGKPSSAVKALQRRGLGAIKRELPAQGYQFEPSGRLPAMGEMT
ncbi:MAG TPA: sigma-70 family RNA polymerase sigma factor [Actinomycetota bacterium]|nr:sigma-70 family RNA polymerase sigma factor [Actinomycetota bacterium]